MSRMKSPYGWGLPLDISTHGKSIDDLIVYFHIFMAVLFIGWFIFLIYLLVRFRARPGHKAEYHVHHSKVPTALEAGVLIVEIVLLVGFSFPIWHQYRNQMPDMANAMNVRIVAEQFAWNVHYPGADGVFGKTSPSLMSAGNPVGLDANDPASKDDVVAINQLHVPVHKPVNIELTSKDVIHSFFLPVARVKMDVIPGQKVPVWFETTQAGDFEIACAQLCGLGHYRMRGFFVVEEQAKFTEWLGQQTPGAPAA